VDILLENKIPNPYALATCQPFIVDEYIKDLEMVKDSVYFKWSTPNCCKKYS